MSGFKIVAKNRKAHFNYTIEETLETGIELKGFEIKAIREGKVDLTGSYARIFGGAKPELFWVGGTIGLGENKDRSKKLLVHKKEILTLIGKTDVKGLTLIPLELILKRGKAKLVIGIAKGKKVHDKREAIKKKDLERERARGLIK